MNRLEQLTESKFNYNQLQPEVAGFLKDKETNMRETVSDAYYQLGKELKEAQNKLSNNRNGIFQEWYESLGFSKSTVYRYIDYHQLIVSQWDKQINLLAKIVNSWVKLDRIGRLRKNKNNNNNSNL